MVEQQPVSRCVLQGKEDHVRTSHLYHDEQVTISNPAEVAKTRLQLQGELARNGGEKVYNNVLDVVTKTWRNEGIRGVQRGLIPAVSTFSMFYLFFVC